MSKVVAVGELTRYLANLISGDRALRNLAVTLTLRMPKGLFLVSCLEAVLPDCALGRRMAWR